MQEIEDASAMHGSERRLHLYRMSQPCSVSALSKADAPRGILCIDLSHRSGQDKRDVCLTIAKQHPLPGRLLSA